jgi:allantoinase
MSVSEKDHSDMDTDHVRSAMAMAAAVVLLIAMLLALPDKWAPLKSIPQRTGVDDAETNTGFPEHPPFVLRSSRVLLPGRGAHPVPADVVVGRDGSIAAVQTWSPDPAAAGLDKEASQRRPPVYQAVLPVVDVSPLLVMPGLVDPHVHINAPGRTDWEGFESATRAAAAGGTTTILDMPLNNVPSTISLAALALKARALADAAPNIDVGFIGGVVPGNKAALPELYRAGVIAFKSFMVNSQSPDFPHVSLQNLSEAMHILAHLDSQASSNTSPFPPYILHAELPPDAYDPSVPYPGDPTSYADYLASRPDAWEVDAVKNILDLVEKSGCRVHIAHISSSQAARLVAKRRNADATLAGKVSSETCPQYLLWAAENIPDARTEYKCAPPIRSSENRRALWHSIIEADSIQMVASDHSPADPTLKRTAEGNLREAWGGISGLQYRLQATWTAMRSLDANVSYALLSELLSAGPARIFGLDQKKGSIAQGMDADFVIWNPDANLIIQRGDCQHKHTFSPFIGANLTGVVHWSLLRGHVVYSMPTCNSNPRCAREHSGLGKVVVNIPDGSEAGVHITDPHEYAQKLTMPHLPR